MILSYFSSISLYFILSADKNIYEYQYYATIFIKFITCIIIFYINVMSYINQYSY